MTRVTSRATVCQRYADTLKYDGQIGTVYVDMQATPTIQTLSRSDITVNPMRADGWRDPSPYDVTLTTAEPGYCDLIADNPGNKRYFRNLGKVHPHTDEPAFKVTATELNSLLPPTSDVDKAVIKARNNVADRVASFGESLVELKQSLSGLGNLASQIDRFLDAASRKDYRGVAKSLGIPHRSRKHRRAIVRYEKGGIPTVSNAFLCWNFGLSPIISDMVALAILLGEGKPLRVVGKGTFPRESGEPGTWTQKCTFSFASGIGGFTANFSNKVSSATYVRLDYTVSLEMLRKLTSFGLLDAPATLWAVAPYSFLVDFVLPVSEVLRSLTATVGLTFKGGTATRFVKVDRKFLNGIPSGGSANTRWKYFRLDVNPLKGRRMVRRVFKTDPNPVTLWVKDPVSAFSVATVFSLLGQKLGKVPRIH